jgi:hypothetical protein
MEKMFALMGKAFKEVKGAEKTITAMGSGDMWGMLEGLIDMFRIFDAIEPIMKVINSLFDILGAAIVKELQPALKDFIRLLTQPDVIAAFTAIGQAIGKVMGVLLNGLGTALVWIANVMQNAANWIHGLKERMAPFVTMIKDLWDKLKPVRDVLAVVVKLFMAIMHPLMAIAKFFLGKAFTPPQTVQSGGVPAIPTIGLPALASGGYIQESGAAIVHRGESVIPKGESLGKSTVYNITIGAVMDRETVRQLKRKLDEVAFYD